MQKAIDKKVKKMVSDDSTLKDIYDVTPQGKKGLDIIHNRQVHQDYERAKKAGDTQAMREAQEQARHSRLLGGTISIGMTTEQITAKNQQILQAKRDWEEAVQAGNQVKQKAAEEKALQARRAGGTISDTVTIEEITKQNDVILKAKQEWQEAFRRSDTKAMSDANRRAEEARLKGGTIGEKQSLDDIAKRNDEIMDAKRDWLDAKARGDAKAMQEAHTRAEKARLAGGTLQEADAYPVQETHETKEKDNYVVDERSGRTYDDLSDVEKEIADSGVPFDDY